MSDLDNVFFLRRMVIKKQRKTVGIAAEGGYTCPLHSLRGTRFGKAAPPASIGRIAPYNPAQNCAGSRNAFSVAHSRANVTHVKPHALPCKAGHLRSFSSHSHCGASVTSAPFARRHRSRIFIAQSSCNVAPFLSLPSQCSPCAPALFKPLRVFKAGGSRIGCALLHAQTSLLAALFA